MPVLSWQPKRCSRKSPQPREFFIYCTTVPHFRDAFCNYLLTFLCASKCCSKFNCKASFAQPRHFGNHFGVQTLLVSKRPCSTDVATLPPVFNASTEEKPQTGAADVSLQDVAYSGLCLAVKRPQHLPMTYAQYLCYTAFHLPASNTCSVTAFHLPASAIIFVRTCLQHVTPLSYKCLGGQCIIHDTEYRSSTCV